MTKIAICTAFYEAARKFVPEYGEGLRAAAAGHDVVLVAAIDGFADHERLSETFGVPVHAVHPGTGMTPAQVRVAMVRGALETDASALVFCDLDDHLLPAALDNHSAALATADISYGDLEIMDETAHPVGRRFFDSANVPTKVSDSHAVLLRNFIGFGNAAIRRTALMPTVPDIPADALAADWWFFTVLLDRGLTAARTPGPVGCYRVYNSNALGSVDWITPELLQQRCAIMENHYRTLPITPWRAAALTAVQALAEQVRRNPPPPCPAPPGVWFDDVTHVLTDNIRN